MAFNVGQFRAQMQGDGARPNLFEISLPLPLVINPGAASQKLTFMARTSQLPGSTMGIVPVYYFGREIKLPGNRTFADWTITIINDEDFIIRNAFEQWSNSINQHRFNLRNPAFSSATSYLTDGTVTQFTKAGDPAKQYKLVGTFPYDISPIDLDWAANDSIEEWTVTMAVQWWEDPSNGIF